MSISDNQKASWRAQFPICNQYAYFDHAAVAPLCLPAYQRMLQWAETMLHHGDVYEGDLWRDVEKSRVHWARFLHTEASQIAFLKNTSEGLALVAEGFPWTPGDNVVMIDQEYPANIYPWMHLRDRGVETKTVVPRDGAVLLEDIAQAIDSHTRLVTLSWVQFSTGYRSDLQAVGQLCRDKGVDFCVDAIQGLGVFDLNLSQLPVDYVSADGHKWMTGPEGAAVFWVAADKLEKIRPTSVGWKNVENFLSFSTIDFRLRRDALRFENGTPPMGGLLGLGSALEFFASVGMETINQAVKEVTDSLVAKLESKGATIHSDRGEERWSGIVSFSLPGVEADDFVERAGKQKVVVSNRAGRLRASPHFYTNDEDIERLIALI